MAERAYGHLVASGNYSYATFQARISWLVHHALGQKAADIDLTEGREELIITPPANLSAAERYLITGPSQEPAHSNSYHLAQKKRLLAHYAQELRTLDTTRDQTLRNVQGAVTLFEEQHKAALDALDAIANQINALQEALDSLKHNAELMKAEQAQLEVKPDNLPETDDLAAINRTIPVLEQHTSRLYALFDQINRGYRQIDTGLARFRPSDEP
jgi:signal transduction histidine kinase